MNKTIEFHNEDDCMDARFVYSSVMVVDCCTNFRFGSLGKTTANVQYHGFKKPEKGFL